MRLGRIVAALILVTAWCGGAEAFWARRAPATRMSMKLDLDAATFNSIGYGPTSFKGLAETALARWNEQGIGSKPDHQFFDGASTAPVTDPCGLDGVNQVRLSATVCDGLDWGDVVGLTKVWIDTARGRVIEADVTFNLNVAWDAYPGPLRSDRPDFLRVVLHELGHVAGLGHPDEIGQSVDAIMNTRVSDTDGLRADDIAGGRTVAWNPDLPSAGAVLASAVLPSGRSVRAGDVATVFATIINTAPAPASACRIALDTAVVAPLAFWTTDPATNSVTGAADALVSIATGGSQTFLLALTPTAPFPSTDVELSFICENTDGARLIRGVNTVLLSASTTPVADVIALAATLRGDGVVHVPAPTGTGVFAVASVNVGSGDQISVTADTGGLPLPATLAVCQTDPPSGRCLAPPAASVTTRIESGATPTFGVFVEGRDRIDFAPATNRIFVRFRDAGGTVRGSTSVAVTSD